MKEFRVFLIVLLLGSSLISKSQKLTGYIDPIIGSGGHGHVFVGASAPFGAVKLGPTNFYKGWDWCSGYHYGDSILIGFSHLHLSGTGIGDLCDVLVMPYTGPLKTDKAKEATYRDGYGSHYSHKNEKTGSGYYSVILDDYNILAELTASERVGFHRYKFPDGKESRIIIDLKEGINDKPTGTQLELADQYTIKGYRFSSGWAKEQEVFFAIKSSKPINDFRIFEDKDPVDGKSVKGTALKGVITFAGSPGTVMLKVGISPMSADNALDNIESEIPDWNFEKVVKETESKWNREMIKVSVKSKNKAYKRILYTSLYHSMMHPSIFNDHNGSYRGTDNKNYEAAGFTNYSIFSTWDTYRAAHPLYTLTNPEIVDDLVNSMLAIYDQQGHLPIWHLQGYETGTMVGISSMQVIAEAYLKGFRGFDAERAYSAIKATAMADMRGLSYVRDLKPIPSNARIGRPVSTALEYAIGDGSVALMAKAMGKTDDYEYFMKRARNYFLYFDEKEGFFRGKMLDGSWNPNFDPLKSTRPYATDYAEGNSWQYLWLVPQDVEGLIKLLGGEEAFANKLDTFFKLQNADGEVLVDLTGLIGQYAHGNEPSHHIAYLYAFAGQQWKTAEKARYIMEEFYHDKPDGIIGNEDCGQMSAWYVFSSLGFYPVFPASGIYVFGSPIFDKFTLNLQNGKKFIVETKNNGPGNIYIQSVSLNGKAYEKSYILHSDLVSGGKLVFEMGNKPNYEFGKLPENRP
jgi:predicted alpha-1,2-mannosidase